MKFGFYIDALEAMIYAERIADSIDEIKIGFIFPDNSFIDKYEEFINEVKEKYPRIYFIEYNPAAICGHRLDVVFIVDHYRFSVDLWTKLILPMFAIGNKYDLEAENRVHFVDTEFHKD